MKKIIFLLLFMCIYKIGICSESPFVNTVTINTEVEITTTTFQCDLCGDTTEYYKIKSIFQGSNWIFDHQIKYINKDTIIRDWLISDFEYNYDGWITCHKKCLRDFIIVMQDEYDYQQDQLMYYKAGYERLHKSISDDYSRSKTFMKKMGIREK